MTVGTVILRLAIFEAASLKDKRRVVKSLKDRLRSRFNVSVAEVGSLEVRQRAEIGVAMVSNDSQHVASKLDKLVSYVRKDAVASLVDHEIELL
jgi:hypothetical protein